MMHFVTRENILPNNSLVVFTVTYRKFVRTVWYFRPEIYIPYFLIDNARVIYTKKSKFVKK